MADPLSIASIGMTAAGGIMSAFGAAKKDDATAAMYTYKAGVAKANAQIAAQNAAYEQELGGVQAQNVGLKGAQELGKIKADQAASGIDVNTGTVAKVRESQIAGIQTAEGTVRSDALRRAYGYQIQGMNFTSEGVLDTTSAQFAKEQKTYDVASSLLGGATSVSDKWLKFSTSGIPGFGGSKGGGDLSVT